MCNNKLIQSGSFAKQNNQHIYNISAEIKVNNIFFYTANWLSVWGRPESSVRAGRAKRALPWRWPRVELVQALPALHHRAACTGPGGSITEAAAARTRSVHVCMCLSLMVMLMCACARGDEAACGLRGACRAAWLDGRLIFCYRSSH